MKNFTRVVLVGIIVVILLGLAGCGKADDPKSLAKQVFEMSQKSMEAILKGDTSAAEKLQKDVEAIQKKVAALSEADQKIFNDECVKLMGDAFKTDDDDADKEDGADEK